MLVELQCKIYHAKITMIKIVLGLIYIATCKGNSTSFWKLNSNYLNLLSSRYYLGIYCWYLRCKLDNVEKKSFWKNLTLFLSHSATAPCFCRFLIIIFISLHFLFYLSLMFWSLFRRFFQELVCVYIYIYLHNFNTMHNHIWSMLSPMVKGKSSCSVWY